MKINLQLNIELNEKDFNNLKEVYTVDEIEKLVKDFLKDTANLSSPLAQKKLIQESKKVMAALKKVRLDK